MLTGKCEIAFVRWYDNKVFAEKEYLLLEDKFSNLPFSMQYGIYEDFFDSVEIYFHTERLPFGNYHAYFHGKNKSKEVFKTRQEARKAAIEQANLIYNK